MLALAHDSKVSARLSACLVCFEVIGNDNMSKEEDSKFSGLQGVYYTLTD